MDMIATGTDVNPLECLLFMRDVKSKGYFEQMKGRGTRTLDLDGLRKVSSAAKSGKTHYVIVDAIVVTKSLKTASRPPVTQPTVPFKDLAMEVVMGASDADTVSSLAGRLARIERQLTPLQKHALAQKMGGVGLGQLVKDLFHAIDGEAIEQKALALVGPPLRVWDAYARTPIPLCSLPEQQEIVRVLDEQFEAIERNERELDAALKRSGALRQSILKRAFAGRLVPQDPADEPASALLARLRSELTPKRSVGTVRSN